MGHPNYSQRYATSHRSPIVFSLTPSTTDLKAGVREKTVLGAFHPQAIELFNVSSDLKRVCWTLADPHARLNEKVWISTFEPVK